jgi:hypothetical protein
MDSEAISLANAFRDLASDPDMEQERLIQATRELVLTFKYDAVLLTLQVESLVSRKPHTAAILAKYGWSFDDDDDIYVSVDSLVELSDQVRRGTCPGFHTRSGSFR